MKKTKLKKKVLVVASHPDDEVLGCGATMAKHSSQGDEVHVLILAEGITSRDTHRSVTSRRGELSALSQSAKKANQILGAQSITLLNFPDNRMDSIPLIEIVKAIEVRLNKIAPQIIYTHSAGDLNIDHQLTHQAVLTACRPMPGSTVERILCFEVLSSTEWASAEKGQPFTPQYFVDVSRYLKSKVRALHAYNSEMKPWPHARSYEAAEYLARLRGTSVGFEAAEAFTVARWLDC